MSDLENLHLALFDLAMGQKELHCDMLLAGEFEAADNAWQCYQDLRKQVDRAAQLVAAQNTFVMVADLSVSPRVRKFAGC